MDLRYSLKQSPIKAPKPTKKSKTPTKAPRLIPDSPAFNCKDLNEDPLRMGS